MDSKYQEVAHDEEDEGKLSESSFSPQESDKTIPGHIQDDNIWSTSASRADVGAATPYPIVTQPHSSYQQPGPSGYPPTEGLSYPPPGACPYPPGPYMPPTGYGYQAPIATTNTTTVILQQANQRTQPRGWSSKLCECGRDWSICCCGLFCESCLERQVAHDMGESSLLPCCVPGWLIVLRTKMRLQENITGSVMNDCCYVSCCKTCTLCQLAYEIKVVRARQMAITPTTQI